MSQIINILFQKNNIKMKKCIPWLSFTTHFGMWVELKRTEILFANSSAEFDLEIPLGKGIPASSNICLQ